MKVLFLTTNNFFKGSDGGNQYNYQNFSRLQTIFGQESVKAICFVKETEKQEIKENVRYFRENTARKVRLLSALTQRIYYDRQTEEQVLQYLRAEKFDCIVLDSLGGRWARIVKKDNPNTKILMIPHNCEKMYYRARMEKEGLHLLPLYLGVVKSERDVVCYADWMSVINERDQKQFEHEYGRKADLILPVSFADTFEKSKIHTGATKRELLFIGSLFAPNLDGILWFVRNVMPKLPEYKLTIVGKGFEKERDALESDNVQVVGTVSDLSEYYYRYPAIVAPIRYGSGMTVKTCEALMYGKTLFASDESLEGYEVEGVKGIYRCNTPDEYVTEIQHFYEQENVPFFQPDVRALFMKKYANEVVQQKLQKSLKERVFHDYE